MKILLEAAKPDKTVDGSLLEAWTSHKSFKPVDLPSDPPGRGLNAEFGESRLVGA